MIRAYSDLYLDDAILNMACMTDYVANDMHMDIDLFFSHFISTGLAERYGKGDFQIVSGMSGIELAWLVLDTAGIRHKRLKPTFPLDKSPEYWAGWALAQYQWHTGLTFEKIMEFIPFSSMVGMYHPYHEMDILHFIDSLNQRYMEKWPDTNLSYIRNKYGTSQSRLSYISGVPLRIIQQYEQRKVNINKAQAEHLYMLSKALFCPMEELLERVPGSIEDVEKGIF